MLKASKIDKTLSQIHFSRGLAFLKLAKLTSYNMKKDLLAFAGMHYGASPRVFKNAAKLRTTMTTAEVQLWDYLKTSPEGYKFRRQHPIGCYVLDFYCHKLRLSIELDGGYHLTNDQVQMDAVRTAYINDLGILELRFMNEEILDNLEQWIVNFTTNLRESSPFRAGEREGKPNDKS